MPVKIMVMVQDWFVSAYTHDFLHMKLSPLSEDTLRLGFSRQPTILQDDIFTKLCFRVMGMSLRSTSDLISAKES